MESPTPMSTAYCSGTSIVSPNVTTSTTFWTVPAFHTVVRSAGLIVFIPMSMRSPASAGMAMFGDRVGERDDDDGHDDGSKSAARHGSGHQPPCSARGRRHRSADGHAWSIPDAMLAAPCPTKWPQPSG